MGCLGQPLPEHAWGTPWCSPWEHTGVCGCSSNIDHKEFTWKGFCLKWSFLCSKTKNLGLKCNIIDVYCPTMRKLQRSSSTKHQEQYNNNRYVTIFFFPRVKMVFVIYWKWCLLFIHLLSPPRPQLLPDRQSCLLYISLSPHVESMLLLNSLFTVPPCARHAPNMTTAFGKVNHSSVLSMLTQRRERCCAEAD